MDMLASIEPTIEFVAKLVAHHFSAYRNGFVNRLSFVLGRSCEHPVTQGWHEPLLDFASNQIGRCRIIASHRTNEPRQARPFPHGRDQTDGRMTASQRPTCCHNSQERITSDTVHEQFKPLANFTDNSWVIVNQVLDQP